MGFFSSLFSSIPRDHESFESISSGEYARECEQIITGTEEQKEFQQGKESPKTITSVISYDEYEKIVSSGLDEALQKQESFDQHTEEKELQEDKASSLILNPEELPEKVMSSLLNLQITHKRLKDYTTLFIPNIFKAAAILGGDYVITLDSKTKESENKIEKTVKDILWQYIYQFTREVFEYRNNNKDTILHQVVRYGDQAIEVTKLILNRLEDTRVLYQDDLNDDLNNVDSFCNMLNEQGEAPLHLAASAYGIKTINLLKERTTDIEIWYKFLKEPYRNALKEKELELEKVKNFFRRNKDPSIVQMKYLVISEGFYKMNKAGIFDRVQNDEQFMADLFSLSVEDLIDIVQRWSGWCDISYRYLPEKEVPSGPFVFDSLSSKPHFKTKEIALFFLESTQFMEKIKHHPGKYSYINVMSQIYMKNSTLIQLEKTTKAALMEEIANVTTLNHILDTYYFEKSREVLIKILKEEIFADHSLPWKVSAKK